VTYSYRMGVIITFVRDDGRPGPGVAREFKASDGWQVEIRDEGCLEISGYGRVPVPQNVVLPWHRVWEIASIPSPGDVSVPVAAQTLGSAASTAITPSPHRPAPPAPPRPGPVVTGPHRVCIMTGCTLAEQPTQAVYCPQCEMRTQQRPG
jgi:hypothetical protein